ncbi:hypothetical protein EBS40_08500 [bacterium]|nr:hypothetical protein [bacterium]
MTRYFHDIQIVRERDARCSVCGSSGEIKWFETGLLTADGVVQLIPIGFKCPNGPHRMTPEEWQRIAPEPEVEPGETPKRRWWRKGQP